jgi:hypothetical protein
MGTRKRISCWAKEKNIVQLERKYSIAQGKGKTECVGQERK